MSKHTPGPWMASLNRENIWQPIDGAAPKLICTIERDDKPEVLGSSFHCEFQANAHLIAAAPELLEVLKELKRERLAIGSALEKRVTALIKKAEGA
jgi:hypothetical protein